MITETKYEANYRRAERAVESALEKNLVDIPPDDDYEDKYDQWKQRVAEHFMNCLGVGEE